MTLLLWTLNRRQLYTGPQATETLLVFKLCWTRTHNYYSTNSEYISKPLRQLVYTNAIDKPNKIIYTCRWNKGSMKQNTKAQSSQITWAFSGGTWYHKTHFMHMLYTYRSSYKLLYACKKLTLFCRDVCGSTLLHLTASNGSTPIVDALLRMAGWVWCYSPLSKSQGIKSFSAQDWSWHEG